MGDTGNISKFATDTILEVLLAAYKAEAVTTFVVTLSPGLSI